jgi:hypothetical protein
MTLTQVTKAGLDEIALDHVFTIGASGTDHYTFQGEGLNGTVNDPTLYLTRGKTYRFEKGSAHPLRIQSTAGANGTAYNTGVINNGQPGTVIVEVQHDAPDVLYYQCTSHPNMNGILYITGALADGGVTEAKIASNAVTTNKIDTNAVTTTKIAADAITNSLIADNAVENANIANGAISTAKIADDAVTGTKIAAEIDNSHITSTANIAGSKLADNSISLAKLEHGTSSNDGKFLRANNGADPTFETVDFTTLNASNLTSGTIPDARFPSTLPAISGANLTGIATAVTAINTQSSAYTLVASDAGKAISLSGDITIPNNVFSAGEKVILVNNSSSFKNLFTGSGLTIYNTNDATYPTGNNTIPARGFCTVFFIGASTAYIEGKVDIVPTFEASNNSTNIVLSSVFGSNWSANIAKIYNVPSGVTVGGTNAGGSAILISSGMGGTLTVNVSGTVIGKGGTGGDGGRGNQSYVTNPENGASGQAGGHGIQVDSANATINNLSGGQISGGGGGGGGGGAGRTGQQLSYFYGGRGGDGGQGQGYNQNQTNGNSGQSGNYNIGGTGGTGGNGGTLGNAGTSGSTGGNATYNTNFGPGSGGSGGAAGKAIWSNNSNSWTNGTTAGTYHGSYT